MQYLVLYIIGLALTSAAGIVTLWLILRHYARTWRDQSVDASTGT
jgi:hypothetical protein